MPQPSPDPSSEDAPQEEPVTVQTAPKASEPPPKDAPEEEEAETKPFLDHLEDLRWTLLKSISVLFVGMCVAFYGNPWIMDALELPLWGIRDVIEQPPLFHPGDLRRAAPLALRLKEASDPVSRYLLERFSAETKKQLCEYDPVNRPAKPLREALIGELNRILKGECIYSPEFFAKVDLSDETHDLLQKKPQGKPLIRLNRLLLEDAYPREVAKAPELVEFNPRKFLWPTGPGEPFIFSIKLALYGGTILALPFILYYIGQFILPALTRREKRYLWPAFSFGGGLFLVGAGFCFFYVMPKALMVSVAWAEWTHLNVTFWRVGDYVGFVTGFMLGMGMAFETPVVILALVKMGILSHAGLKKGRRYWIIFSLVAGALLTTPEVFTQLVMGAVLMILYEVSIWGAWIIERRERTHAMDGDDKPPGGDTMK